MTDLFVTAEGGLTTAGYAASIIFGIVVFIAAAFLAGKTSEKKKMSATQLVFCAAALALAFVASYIRVFKMPWGGSVTFAACCLLFSSETGTVPEPAYL